MENPSGRTILVKFREAPGYGKVGATGIYGGITPAGDVLCHFIIDYREIPDESKHLLQEGHLVPEVPEEGNPSTPTIIRELQVGVLLPARVVRSIGEWFISQSDALEQIAQGDNPS